MSYVWGGWSAAAAIIAAYTWRTVRRGRILGRSVPPGEKTWR